MVEQLIPAAYDLVPSPVPGRWWKGSNHQALVPQSISQHTTSDSSDSLTLTDLQRARTLLEQKIYPGQHEQFGTIDITTMGDTVRRYRPIRYHNGGALNQALAD